MAISPGVQAAFIGIFERKGLYEVSFFSHMPQLKTGLFGLNDSVSRYSLWLRLFFAHSCTQNKSSNVCIFMIMGLLTLCVHESHGISFVHGHEQIGHVCLSMRVPTQLETYLEPKSNLQPIRRESRKVNF